jgi:hypothetical protein
MVGFAPSELGEAAPSGLDVVISVVGAPELKGAPITTGSIGP